MTRDDLQTAKGTRQALQRGLIQRRPGLYLRKWLGDRLGVSETTIWRYCRQLTGLQVTPTFTQTPLGWHNLNAIPAPTVATVGTCLEDTTGKRWPAVKGIAQKLLAQGRGVRLLVRSPNYYWYGTGDPPVTADYQLQCTVDVAPAVDTCEPVVTFAQQVARLVRTVKPVTNPGPVPAPATVHRTPYDAPPFSAGYTKSPKKLRRRYRKPLRCKTDEVLAETVYSVINARTKTSEARISLATARRWVDTYGEAKVRRTLAVLASRIHIQRPAGFTATFLRTVE